MNNANADPARREFGWIWVWVALIAAAAVGTGVAVLLWGHATAEHRDAFDTGWKSAASILAILAAILGVERLRLGQREHYRQLAADQAAHITDLSAKASEQLGSDKAAVRIGGLTDLERLGQAHPQLRQTVIDRICAYLRAPYEPPPDPGHTADDSDSPSTALSREDVAARRLELDVRRTAQQILQRHLHRFAEQGQPPDSFWHDMNLDLRDAVLIETDFTFCQIATAKFQNATFHGDASFGHATFTGDAWFAGATFAGSAWFGSAIFTGLAGFRGATFTGIARFVNVTFPGVASFVGAMSTIGIDLTDVRVTHPTAGHVWPPHWHVEPIPDDPDAAGRLVHSDPLHHGDAGFAADNT